MPVQSEAEAIQLLRETRSRLIAQGYEIAVMLAARDGTVTAQAVLWEMDRRGLLSREKSFRRNWAAVIFVGSEYRDTWERCGLVKIGDDTRNTHATLRSVWRLCAVDTSGVCWGEDDEELRDEADSL